MHETTHEALLSLPPNFQLLRESLSTFVVVVQLQCFVQPIEGDFMEIKQSTGLAMILGPVFAGEGE